MDNESNRQRDGSVGFVRRQCMPVATESAALVEEGRPGYRLEDALRRLDYENHREQAASLGAAGEENPREAIIRVCNELRDFLVEKNKAYGNSAFEPINIFSKLPPIEGVLIRIDDKLKRIRNGKSYPGDNDLKDLAGYLILLMVLMEMNDVA